MINLPKIAINIACGDFHTVVLFSDDSVYACGLNSFGQLGIDSTIDQSTLQPMIDLPEGKFASNISCGGYHTVVLFSDGSVYACGWNSNGELGINSTEQKDVLTQMVDSENKEITGAINIACGAFHTVVLFSDGSVYACGLNNYGQLGIGNYNEQTTLQPMSNLPITGAINIACGYYHTVVLFSDKTVYACGFNNWGQLGIGSSENQTTLQLMIDLPTSVSNISCGALYTIILFDNNTVYSCGDNQYGQLCQFNVFNTLIFNNMILPTNLNPGVVPIKVACGFYHTVVLFSDGSVYACGYNVYGQLGINKNYQQILQENILTQMVDSNNILITGAINIACGAYYTVVLFTDGSVYACGQNSNGQLGIKSTEQKNVLTQMIDSSGEPITGAINIACGGYYTVVLFSDGSVYACGQNSNGQLGIKSTEQKNVLTQMINLLKTTINIACGEEHTVVLFSDGTVYSCGSNQYGQLGINSSEQQKNVLTQMVDSSDEEITGAINIACGIYHTVVLFNNNTVYACGWNYYGQLGINKTLNEVEYKNVLTQMVNSSDKEITDAINIACGASHTVVLFSDGSVYACGDNQSGQLGINSTQQQITLQPMLYAPNNTNINFDIASTAVFCVIFLYLSQINIQEKYNGTGIYNINLSPSTYNIYTYIPEQPVISIINSDVIFENKYIGTNKEATINIIQIQDTTSNTNYAYVNSYITTGKILNSLLQYINKYTNIKNLSKLEVIRIKNNSYAVIGYQNKLFSVLIE